MSTDVPKTEEFYELIERASRKLRRHALLIGATLVALVAISWLSVAVAVDLLIPLATMFRLLLAVGFWAVLIGSVAGLLVWPALRRLTLEDVALRIESIVGGMHNRLLTVLDLHRTDAEGKKQSNPEMVARLLWQTRGKLADFHLGQIVSPLPLLRSLIGLAAVLFAALLLAVLFRESAPTALARILRPTADIPPATWLKFTAPGELAAPAGDPLTIGVDVTRGDVDLLSLHLQQPDGRWVVYPMQRDGERRFSYTLSGVMTDYRYKISGGGTWTGEYPIRMVPRPIVDAVAAAIRLPRYMQREDQLPVADDVRRIEAPIDSHLLLSAQVSGDVARGEVVLLRRLVDTREQVQDEEHVWFEDDLPADAQTDGVWRWSTAQTFTGLKSFMFGRNHQPFGFTSRLTPLQVPAAGIFYLMVRLDAADPPGRITLRLEQDNNQRRAFEWGDKSTPPQGQPQPVLLGPLPPPAHWTRLEVPADALGSNPSGAKFRGLSLEIDHGQAFVDRPGYLIRKSRPVETVRMEMVDTLPMHRDASSDRWLGDVPVAVDRMLTVRFHSSLGQASADREPLELIAIKDQPPSILVEKPGLDVVLPGVQPLPIAAQALDDWGLAAVGIQIGPSDSALGSVRWQPCDAPLPTSRNMIMAIDAKAENLAPNQSLWYRLVAKDCNGQTAESKTFKLSIAPPDRAGAPETAKPPESLQQLVELVAQMAKAPHKAAESAEFVAGLPVALRASIDAQGQFRKNGSPMQADEIRQMIQTAEAELTPQQKQRLAELTAELDRRQQELKKLAEMLKSAAQKSAASPLVSQQDSKLLTQFSGLVAAMAADVSPLTATQDKAAPLERELRAEKLAADQPARLADLEQQLRQLEAARLQMASDPQLAEQMLDDQTTQVEGAAAARELEALATDLDARGEQLLAIEGQASEMAEQGAKADGKQLVAIGQSQTALDQQALSAIDQLRGILGLKPDDDAMPLAPWTPPGEKFESTPVEEDVPDADKKAMDKGDENAPGDDKDAAKPDEDENWWDKPADVPTVGGPRGEESDRYKDRHRPVPDEKADEPSGAAGGKSKPPEPTPRQQLTAHQAQIQQALTANADDARKAGAVARAMAQRLAQSSSSQATAAPTPATPAGQTPAEAQQRAAAARRMLADGATRQALSSAQRMHATSRSQSGPPQQVSQPGGGGGLPRTVSVQPGRILPGEVPLGSDPRERAQFYQLPPRLREPLLEGMQERGPEGYQPMIDAYFRELSKEVK
ncbi:MAG TPA: hypothetical protein VHY91_00290 [Pirellulales bacterium]|jgi:hypothetical protein|nr:hypothetical protein [Pirellulales bacterium]